MTRAVAQTPNHRREPVQYYCCRCLGGGINSLHEPPLGPAPNSAAWGPAEKHWDTFVSIILLCDSPACLQILWPAAPQSSLRNKFQSGWGNQNKELINEQFWRGLHMTQHLQSTKQGRVWEYISDQTPTEPVRTILAVLLRSPSTQKDLLLPLISYLHSCRLDSEGRQLGTSVTRRIIWCCNTSGWSGANVVANSNNAVDCTAVCNDLPSVSGFWNRVESRKIVTEKLSYKKTKGKASN